MFRQGFEGVLMMRSGGDCVVLRMWAEEQAVHELVTSAAYVEAVTVIKDQGFVTGDQHVETFGVHLAELTT